LKGVSKYREERRGRPKETYKLRKALTSIILIVRKYDLDPKSLLEAFIAAWRNKIHHYRNLQIFRRWVNQDSATFLITKEEKVVSQLHVTLEVLRNPDALKNLIREIHGPQQVY